MCAAKPSLFKRPAWAATASSAPSEADRPVFGQQRVYDEIMAEKIRVREKQEARRREKAQKTAAEDQAPADGPAAKKRRVSRELPDVCTSDISDISEATPRSSPSLKKSTPEPVAKQRVTRSLPTKAEHLLKGLDDPQRVQKSRPEPTVIRLDDDDDVDDDGIDPNVAASRANHRATESSRPPSKPRKSKPVHAAVDKDEDEDEDPFIRELQRKAREKAKARQQEIERARIATPFSPTRAGSVHALSHEQGSTTPVSPGVTDATATPEPSASQSQSSVPNVAILIKSYIPGTKDLVVHRHASQSLSHVKNFWCRREKLEASLSQQLFFTWRGTRLYNSSTMTSLINVLKREQGIPLESDEDPSNGRIQIDAVTQEILEQQRLAKEAADKARQAGDQGATGEDEPPPELKKDGVILILKCKDIEPMPLRVRPNTSVARIMRAFQGQRNIDKSKTCWLVFDGERLEQDQTVQSVGFEDEDEVEVHPR